jgi:O-acetyl-ADP-ribose deacetylase (regulator of RNase III)
MLWRASERSIRDSTRNALSVARATVTIRSLAFPLIGAGSGGFREERVLALMTETLADECDDVAITLVRYR